MELNPTLVPAFRVPGPREQTHTMKLGSLVGVRWDGWSGGIRAKFRGKVFKTAAVRDDVANVLHSMDMEATTKGCERGGEDAKV